MKIANWDEWQTYRNDRGAPPWIKIHRSLLTSSKWAVLTDSEKGQLISLWIVAADKSGEIPDDPRILMKVCQLDDHPNINKFIELGFLVAECQPNDTQTTPKRQPNDSPEERRGEESIVEKSRGHETKKLTLDIKSMRAMRPDDVDKQLWDEYLQLRSRKKADKTERAMKAIIKSLVDCMENGVSRQNMIEMCVEKGWKGVTYEWYRNEKGDSSGTSNEFDNKDYQA